MYEQSIKAFERLKHLAENPPPGPYHGCEPHFGYWSWIAQLQSAQARYERALKRERRAERRAKEAE